ncbi:MAG: sigma-70 family RNA polymerase sigma factor [Planctomycetales bacterium]|nr:sigma-70 family RNA polymerase sigma factor [Planctomycetales bacterium]
MPPQVAQETTNWSALLDASRNGDDVAFGEICDRLTDYLMLTASSGLGGDLSAKLSASGIVQETLLEARQDIVRFQGASEAELRAWLARLMQHNLTEAGRRYRRTEMRDVSRKEPCGTESVPELQRTAGSFVRRRKTDDQLLRAVAQLPASRRKMIELRHWQGLSFAEIGRGLEITESAARSLWARAIEELRKKLADD